MKRLLAAIVICASTLLLPSALFAQSDGSVTPVSTATDTPQVGAIDTTLTPPATSPQPATAPAPRPRAVTQQGALAPTPATTPAAPISLDDIQGFVDTAAEHAPPAFEPWLSALAGALAALVAVLGLQAALKRAKKKGTKPCTRCKGTGKEPASKKCATCGGTGKVEEEHDIDAECPHCEGEGEEPCETCDGEGKIGGEPCEACGGEGAARDEDGEAVKCGVCHGVGEASVTLKKNVPCPDCQDGA